jgi:hypothetical protein
MAILRSAVRSERSTGTPFPDNPTGPFEPPPQAYAAYAVPGPGAPVNNPLGWAPTGLRPSTQEYPSAQRTGDFARIDMRPDPGSPPEFYWQPRDRDERTRHSVEEQDADGWTEQKGFKKVGRNARDTPPPEDRPTMSMAPSTYTFTRPFDQERTYGDVRIHWARQMNGTHFSMADHRRDYPILGMAPANRVRRNTYRLMPAPWDTNLIDLPPDAGSAPYERVRSQEVSQVQRSYRL